MGYGSYTDFLTGPQTCAGIVKDLGTSIASAPDGSLDSAKHKTQQDFLQTQAILDPLFVPIRKTYELNNRQMALAAAIGTGMLVHLFAKHLNPNVGFGVAAVAFTEGSKTIPAPLEE